MMTIDKSGPNQSPSRSPQSPVGKHQGPEILPPNFSSGPDPVAKATKAASAVPTAVFSQWFLWFLGFPAFIVIVLSGIALGDTVKALWERSAVLDMVVGIALAGWVLVIVVIVIREWLAMKRLDWLVDILPAPRGEDSFSQARHGCTS